MILRELSNARLSAKTTNNGSLDLTISILALDDANIPVKTRLEDVNLLPILEGKGQEVEQTLFWGVRRGQGGLLAVRSGKWKLVIDGSRPLLFDLQADISERDNLVGHLRARVRGLKTLLTAWEADVYG